MYQAGMNTGGGIVPMDALRIMYPLGYWDIVKEQADTFEIDPFISRDHAEESHYNPGLCLRREQSAHAAHARHGKGDMQEAEYRLLHPQQL
jgi:hypothetical protein